VEALFRSFLGRTYRAVPESQAGKRPVNPVDASFGAVSSNNRWNGKGFPTLYLAGDVGVVIGEWARNIEITPIAVEEARPRPKEIWEIEVDLGSILDLRDESTLDALGISSFPTCFFAKEYCREVADRIRADKSIHGILVPSLAFLDRPDRWCMVIFADNIPGYPGNHVRAIRSVAPLRSVGPSR